MCASLWDMLRFSEILLYQPCVFCQTLPNVAKYRYFKYLCSKLWTMWKLYNTHAWTVQQLELLIKVKFLNMTSKMTNQNGPTLCEVLKLGKLAQFTWWKENFGKPQLPYILLHILYDQYILHGDTLIGNNVNKNMKFQQLTIVSHFKTIFTGEHPVFRQN